MIIRSGHQNTKTVRIEMKPSSYRYRKSGVRLSHDVQQHGVARVHGVIVRRDPCGDIIHNLPCDQVRSVNLRAEEPLVVVSVNREISVLQITDAYLVGIRKEKVQVLTEC